jgi:hypothetical protein
MERIEMININLKKKWEYLKKKNKIHVERQTPNIPSPQLSSS